jgi:hypothetical protein
MDFISAKEAQLEGVSDPDFLTVAAREDRGVLTSDLKTMPRHFGDFLQTHGHAPGVFLVKQKAPLADVIDDLVMVWAASDADEWRNRIIDIPQR